MPVTFPAPPVSVKRKGVNSGSPPSIVVKCGGGVVLRVVVCVVVIVVSCVVLVWCCSCHVVCRVVLVVCVTCFSAYEGTPHHHARDFPGATCWCEEEGCEQWFTKARPTIGFRVQG